MKENLINSDFLKKLDRLKLNSNIVLNKGYSGLRKSKSKGQSVEFSDFREYTHGDDYRKIDWNVYARFEKLFIKLFMEEREALINIFLDCSKSMDFGNPKKSLTAQKIALALGYLSLSNMDKINLFIQEDGFLKDTDYLQGKNSFSTLVNYVDSINFDNKRDFFSLIKSRTYKKGVSIIISDLFTTMLKDSIKYLSYMKQTIIIIQVLSLEEIKPNDIGDIRFIDSETDEAKDVSVTPQVLSSYNDTFSEFINEIKELCNKYGCSYTLVSNKEHIDEIILDNLIKARILR